MLNKSSIQTKNKLGIISYIKLNEDDTMEDSPYIIITPRNIYQMIDMIIKSV